MTRRKTILFGIAASTLGLAIGLYAAEVVFRFALLVPSIPESDAHFRTLISDGWPPGRNLVSLREQGCFCSWAV